VFARDENVHLHRLAIGTNEGEAVILLHCFAYIYAECSFMELYEDQALADEVIAYLRRHGFRLQGIYNMAYDPKGNAVEGDFLFAKGRVSLQA